MQLKHYAGAGEVLRMVRTFVGSSTAFAWTRKRQPASRKCRVK